MTPIQSERRIFRVEDGIVQERTDAVVSEYALTIKVNGEEFSTVVCTPEHLEDMVVGFLASEGIIRSLPEIQSLLISSSQGIAYVQTENSQRYYQLFRSKRYITSCCGMSRQGFVFVNDSLTAKKMDGVHVQLTLGQCFELVHLMQQESDLFQATGGVNNASLCTPSSIVVSRKDIGRHNALDKIYGYCLRKQIDPTNKVLVFSGRISSEILLNASNIGCEIILSKSAPTELALSMAEDLGITTVGFVRDSSLNIYTRADRIIDLGLVK